VCQIRWKIADSKTKRWVTGEGWEEQETGGRVWSKRAQTNQWNKKQQKEWT
jgi:hypothetical protein